MNSPDWLAWQLRERKKLGAMDKPDKRDWTPEKMFGSVDNFPERIVPEGNFINLASSLYALNQKGNTCTSQALTAGMQIMLTLGADFFNNTDNFVGNTDRKPYELWEDQKHEYEGTMGTANDSYGDYLQNALKTAYVRGVPMLAGDKIIIVRIKNYSFIKTSEISEWIERGHPVFTGSDWIQGRVGNRYRSYDDKGFLFEKSNGEKSYGHAYLLVGSYQGIVSMFNSHGERWGIAKRGTAYLSPQKQKELMSKYIFNLDWELIDRQLSDNKYRVTLLEQYYASKK